MNTEPLTVRFDPVIPDNCHLQNGKKVLVSPSNESLTSLLRVSRQLKQYLLIQLFAARTNKPLLLYSPGTMRTIFVPYFCRGRGTRSYLVVVLVLRRRSAALYHQRTAAHYISYRLLPISADNLPTVSTSAVKQRAAIIHQRVVYLHYTASGELLL